MRSEQELVQIVLARLKGFDTRGMRETVQAVKREIVRARSQNATQLEHAKHAEDYIDKALGHMPEGCKGRAFLLKALDHIESIKKEERMEDRHQADVEVQFQPMAPQMISLFANVTLIVEEVC